jgi:hypothetical protein
MPAILTVHTVVGVIVVLTALLLVWRRAGRRFMLYALTIQIILGIAVASAGYRPAAEHWVTAVLGWAGYMAANGLQRRRGAASAGTVRALTIFSSLLVLWAFYVGMRGLRVAP